MQNPISKLLKENGVNYFQLYSEKTSPNSKVRRLHWWGSHNINEKTLRKVKKLAKKLHGEDLISVIASSEYPLDAGYRSLKIYIKEFVA